MGCCNAYSYIIEHTACMHDTFSLIEHNCDLARMYHHYHACMHPLPLLTPVVIVTSPHTPNFDYLSVYEAHAWLMAHLINSHECILFN